ncbi:MAG: DUF2029 domain-containing protein [Kiritimatiellae bacterium]|nr:DUF2029 domain-containing protein [Kiritimatiellia bacterium]
MIPKIIHCCWFGGPKPKLAEKCLASWRRFAPEWTIREWTHDELRLRASGAGVDTAFFEAAIAARKWAMASDWVRMLVLWLEGGIYFDLDVELVSPIEGLPEGEWVSGEWTARGGVWMNPGGGIALEKGSLAAKEMLAAYSKLPFDPKREMMPWINEKLADTKLRTLDPEATSPIGVDGRLRNTALTVAVHHYAMSWATPWQRTLRWFSWHGMRGAVDALLEFRSLFARSGWLALLAIVSAILLAVASVAKGFWNGLEWVDFHWESAALFLRGENPYRWFLEGRLYDGVAVDATQAPSTIAFLLPFGLLPHGAANALWDVCNLGFTFMFLLFMGRLFFPRGGGMFLAFAAIFLCGVPWRVGMGCGQHAMFSLAFFTAAVWAMERRKHWLVVGALLSAGLFKYTVTAPLAFVFVIRRQWRALVAAAAIHIALTVVMGLWTGTDPLTLVRQSMEVGVRLNQSGGDADLAGLASWLGVADVWGWAKLGYAVFGLAIAGYSAMRLLGRSQKDSSLLLDLSVLAVLANLVCYHRCYDLVSLAFPLALCLTRCPAGVRNVLPWALVVNAFFLLRIDFAFGIGLYNPVNFTLHLLTLLCLLT